MTKYRNKSSLTIVIPNVGSVKPDEVIETELELNSEHLEKVVDNQVKLKEDSK